MVATIEVYKSRGDENLKIAPVLTTSPLLFRMSAVIAAHKTADGRSINIFFKSSEMFTVEYTHALWELLEKELNT